MRYFQTLPLFAAAASALTAAQWRSQSIYQVLTDRFANTAGSTTTSCSLGNYCGGTWQGITNKLDYIQGMGFTAVWISPIVKNINGGTRYGDPYHGYWAQDIYSLNSAFGTAADLKALSTALHARGMYLMVDVAPNHYAYNGAPASVDYTTFKPFNDKSYYHPYCETDYNNATSVQVCWAGDTVVSLPDLRTENADVQAGMNSWIAGLVANYSIDGLRLDSAMAVNQNFWPTFISSSNVYAIGEVLDGNPTTFGAWQSYMPGMLNYPTYYWLIRAFQSTSSTMTELANNIQWLNTTVADITLLGNFIENHDQSRFASYTTNVGLTNNAVAFSTFNDGIPVVYYGQEQGFTGVSDPNNRAALWPSLYTKTAMYNFIAKLNAARKVAISKDATYVSTKSSVIYFDTKVMVTRKGATSSPLISLISNYGTGGYGSVLVSGVPASTSFTDLLTCDIFSSTSAGKITLSIVNGAPRALYKTSALSGSDPCATVSSTTSALKTTTTPTSSTLKTTTSSTTSAASSVTSITCPKSNSTTFASNGKSFVVECGIDHAGGDLSMVYVTGLTACINKCASTTGCTNAALSGTACYLKSSLGKALYNGINGARLITSGTTSGTCTPATSVAVSFNANVTTAWLETIKVVGSIAALGTWNTASAVQLSSAGYTSTNTIWNGTVSFPPGTYFEYKFIKVNSSSSAVTFENGSNRAYTVPTGCATTAIVNASWQF